MKSEAAVNISSMISTALSAVAYAHENALRIIVNKSEFTIAAGVAEIKTVCLDVEKCLRSLPTLLTRRPLQSLPCDDNILERASPVYLENGALNECLLWRANLLILNFNQMKRTTPELPRDRSDRSRDKVPELKAPILYRQQIAVAFSPSINGMTQTPAVQSFPSYADHARTRERKEKKLLIGASSDTRATNHLFAFSATPRVYLATLRAHTLKYDSYTYLWREFKRRGILTPAVCSKWEVRYNTPHPLTVTRTIVGSWRYRPELR
ncbi:hypothetical protein HNY73_023145 [Argiope bruennichi]|uniref:Uncharacterized protein n=1 Tax=Argiope bruennichi TaxID=94029 RepID=A0A8T0E4R5_ARGBR|nr:hypothetical protein HNY73_023145 [Argiope bruennichi]